MGFCFIADDAGNFGGEGTVCTTVKDGLQICPVA
jgi:hypothetical protein